MRSFRGGRILQVTHGGSWCYDHLGHQKHALPCEAAQALIRKKKKENISGVEA